MKTAAWKKLVRRQLLPFLPEIRLVGTLLVVGDINWILHGLVLDTSAFSASTIQVTALHQPLYVPDVGLRGDYGEDLRHPKSGYDWWDVNLEDEVTLGRDLVEAIRRQAFPFLAQVENPVDLALYSERRYPGTINPPTIEVEACGWALIGDTERFMNAYNRIVHAMTTIPVMQPWDLAVLNRAENVLKAVKMGPESVHQLLGAWREESIRRYKLDKDIALGR